MSCYKANYYYYLAIILLLGVTIYLAFCLFAD